MMTKTNYLIGTLYVVATPIGNLADISQRAIDTLQEVDLIACEDTRHSRRLLQHYGIQTALTALHEHNERERSRRLIDTLKTGKNIALISDAGTPLINDPGYILVREARSAGITVVPIPGPCAFIAALSVSGLPTDRFIFEGFLPAKKKARQERLSVLKTESRTLIFYEAPHRIQSSLSDLLAIFGVDRHVVLARELTKKFETIYDGQLKDVVTWLMENPDQQRGEFVMLVHGYAEIPEEKTYVDALRILTILQEELFLKQAVALTSKITGENKNRLYSLALKGTFKN